ncbi:MAG: hypothetical protein E7646_08500 [Ruminococcaceae bacterium]|nr:hypothetical protein [Oscillospiraceae bacterium]
MLKAGFSRIDVTPPLGAELSGYFQIRYAKGVLDPIYLNTLALNDGKNTVILMALDFIGIRLPFIQKLKKRISERTSVPEDNVIIGALHQHTSCRLDSAQFTDLTDENYKDVLFRKMEDSAVMAIEDMSDAKVFTGEKETAEPIAFVRRYFSDQGEVLTNPRTSMYKIVKRCSEADNTVRLIRFAREDKNDIVLLNFSTHPDVIGGEKLSADWPGFARRFVEEDFDDVSCIFFTGLQGDSNHIDFFKPSNERIKFNDGYKHSEYMGRTVANAVKAIFAEPLKEHTGTDLFSQWEINYNLTNTEGIEKYDECKEWYEKYQTKTLGYTPKMGEISYAYRIIELRTAPVQLPVPLSVVGIGDIAFVGFGGEAFTDYGRNIRKLFPDKYLIFSVCTNGYEGYFPTEEAFKQGGYEANSSLYTPTLEKEILSSAKRMLDQF